MKVLYTYVHLFPIYRKKYWQYGKTGRLKRFLDENKDLIEQDFKEEISDITKINLPGLCDFTYSVPNPVKPQSLDESFIRCHGRLGHLGDCEWRTEADHRVHRERNHDGTV